MRREVEGRSARHNDDERKQRDPRPEEPAPPPSTPDRLEHRLDHAP